MKYSSRNKTLSTTIKLYKCMNINQNQNDDFWLIISDLNIKNLKSCTANTH